MAKDSSNRGGCYCRPENKGKGLLGRTSTKWCPDCKFKIRGSVEGHNAGDRHKGIVPKRNRY